MLVIEATVVDWVAHWQFACIHIRICQFLLVFEALICAHARGHWRYLRCPNLRELVLVHDRNLESMRTVPGVCPATHDSVPRGKRSEKKVSKTEVFDEF